MIETLLGPIEPEAMGVTYAHEHLLTRPPLWRIAEDPDYVLDSKAKALAELEFFELAGGRSLLDATARDYGRDARALLDIAHAARVHLIAVTGWNRGDYGEEAASASVEALVEVLLGDLRQGMDGTEARAGAAKLGTSYNVILPAEEKMARAVGYAQIESGCAVLTHTTGGTLPLEQLDLLEQTGADLSKVAIGHLDQNLDFDLLREVCYRGAYVAFDGPSKTKYAPDSARIEMLGRLIEEGYAERLMISGDMGRRSYLRAYGGGPGFEYILSKFVPRLRANGFDEALIELIFVTNPARWLDNSAART
jgi:5-phospho-D-xylono-1,4-lactonase